MRGIGDRGRAAARLVALGAILVGAAAAMAGCSQVAAIAPVGGSREAEVRYAAIDVLQDAGIDVLTTPVCVTAQDDAEIRCMGTTFDGAAIEAVSPADAPDTFTLTVGDRTLYDGSISEVLEAAMQG